MLSQVQYKNTKPNIDYCTMLKYVSIVYIIETTKDSCLNTYSRQMFTANSLLVGMHFNYGNNKVEFPEA